VNFTEYSDQLRNIGTRYLTEGMQAYSRYARAAIELPGSKNSPDKFVRFAQDEGVDFAKKLFQCNVDYYLGVLNVGLDLSQNMFESVLNKKNSTTSANTEETVAPDENTQKFRTKLFFTGKQGDTVSQEFVIANNQQEKINITFEVSEFVSADGQVKVRLPVSFNPAQFELEQGQEQIVECQVVFSDLLAPDQPHQAIARVVGYPDMQVRLILNN